MTDRYKHTDIQSHMTDTQTHRDRYRHRNKEIHETAFRQASVQTQTIDRQDGRHRKHEAESSNLNLLSV